LEIGKADDIEIRCYTENLTAEAQKEINSRIDGICGYHE